MQAKLSIRFLQLIHQLYSPDRPMVDTAEVFLWLMAICIVLCVSMMITEQEKLLKEYLMMIRRLRRKMSPHLKIQMLRRRKMAPHLKIRRRRKKMHPSTA